MTSSNGNIFRVTGPSVFSLICEWTNCWANNREAVDLRIHRAHYDVTVMHLDVSVRDNQAMSQHVMDKVEPLWIIWNKPNIKHVFTALAGCNIYCQVYRHMLTSCDGYNKTHKLLTEINIEWPEWEMILNPMISRKNGCRLDKDGIYGAIDDGVTTRRLRQKHKYRPDNSHRKY